MVADVNVTNIIASFSIGQQVPSASYVQVYMTGCCVIAVIVNQVHTKLCSICFVIIESQGIYYTINSSLLI